MPLYTPPAVAEKRLSLTRNGMVRYELKTPYRDGATPVIFESLDFILEMRLDAARRCTFTRQGFTQKDQFAKHFTLVAGTDRHD